MNYYREIKNLIEEKEVNNKVRYLESNKKTIKTYYEIGKFLIKAWGWRRKSKVWRRVNKEVVREIN